MKADIARTGLYTRPTPQAVTDGGGLVSNDSVSVVTRAFIGVGSSVSIAKNAPALEDDVAIVNSNVRINEIKGSATIVNSSLDAYSLAGPVTIIDSNVSELRAIGSKVEILRSRIDGNWGMIGTESTIVDSLIWPFGKVLIGANSHFDAVTFAEGFIGYSHIEKRYLCCR